MDEKKLGFLIVVVLVVVLAVWGLVGLINEKNLDGDGPGTGIGDEERFYCDSEFEERPDVCIEIYDPVCGWYSERVKCLTYPCAETFSNSCFSCSNRDVEYYTLGACPGEREVREEGPEVFSIGG